MVALVKRVERFPFTEVPRRGFPRRSCGAERRVRQALLTRRSRRKRASHSSRGEVRKIRSYRLAFVRGEAPLQLLQILKVQLSAIR
jgi:hypothetical protein